MRALRSLIAKDNPLSIAYAARTAGAAVFSLLVAHILRLPEPYWAGMTTLAVMQATPEAGLPAAAQYFAGTAVARRSEDGQAIDFPATRSCSAPAR